MRTTLSTVMLMILMAYSHSTFCQPTYPPPSGVYCSCGPTTGSGNGSVDPAVAAKPFVKGILVRVSWKNLETSDNVYNWSLIDGQIAAAQSYGKKISLAIGSGINAPSWLYSLGTQTMSFTVPFAGTLPVLWNTTYLDKWTEFIRALGNRYKNDTTIRLVYFTNSTTNGYEMQLPSNPSPGYVTLGYTDAKVITSWKRVIDTFNVAFPNHYLSNDFHPVNGSNAPADSIYAYANLKLGNRYGANAWWWTQNNTNVYPSQYTILKNSTATNLFSGVQMAYNGTQDSASFGAGGMPAALQLAISKGVCYWEIWNQDILNSNFATLLTNATCTGSTTGVDDYMDGLDNLMVYPNPAQNEVTLDNSGGAADLEVIDPYGRRIYSDKNVSGKIVITTNKFPDGIYIVRKTVNNKVGYRRFVVSH